MDDAVALLQSLIQQAASMADEFSEEEMVQILQVFKDAAEILQSQGNIQTPTPEVPEAPYPSSNVNGFNYNPDTQELQIQFHGPYPQAQGPIYSYTGVPKFIYDVLERGAVGPKTSGKNRYHEWIRGVTPSHGAVVNSLIKAGGFPYQKVS